MWQDDHTNPVNLSVWLAFFRYFFISNNKCPRKNRVNFHLVVFVGLAAIYSLKDELGNVEQQAVVVAKIGHHPHAAKTHIRVTKASKKRTCYESYYCVLESSLIKSTKDSEIQEVIFANSAKAACVTMHVTLLSSPLEPAISTLQMLRG